MRTLYHQSVCVCVEQDQSRATFKQGTVLMQFGDLKERFVLLVVVVVVDVVIVR